MADKKAVHRFHKNVNRAIKLDSTLPKFDKSFVERWVSDLSPWQLDVLKTYTAPINFNKDREVWRALFANVARFYEDKEKFDATVKDDADTVSITVWLASDPSEPNPKIEKSTVILKLDATVKEDTDTENTTVWLASDPSEPNPTIEKSAAIQKPDAPGVVHEDKTKFKGIYAPLPKFNIPDLKEHWSDIIIYFQNVVPAGRYIQEFTSQLNSITPGASPLATIRQYLQLLLDTNSHATSFVLEHFRSVVGSVGTLPPNSKIRIPLTIIAWNSFAHIQACHHPWFSCDVIAMLILSLASPAPKLSALRNLPPGKTDPFLKPNPFKDLREAEFTPSRSLRMAFEYAKAETLGPQKRTTILMVGLVDTEHWRLPHYPDARRQKAKCDAHEYISLTHFFVLGIEPEGMTMWQSWKYMGPVLADHVALGGAKVRSWPEAQGFVEMFEDLVSRDVGKVFSSTKNEQYRKLFGVDIFDILAHHPNVRYKEVFPKFVPWVDIRMVENVQSSDVVKFEWWADPEEIEHSPESRPVHCRWS